MFSQSTSITDIEGVELADTVTTVNVGNGITTLAPFEFIEVPRIVQIRQREVGTGRQIRHISLRN